MIARPLLSRTIRANYNYVLSQFLRKTFYCLRVGYNDARPKNQNISMSMPRINNVLNTSEKFFSNFPYSSSGLDLINN